MQVRPYFAQSKTGSAELSAITSALSHAFSAKGYTLIDLPILQPADIYLDMAGEDVRQRMFVIERKGEPDLALRADLTVPVCRRVIEEKIGPLPLRLSYEGPCFRSQAGDSGMPAEFLQSGIELIGVSDQVSANDEVFTLAMAALRSAGLTEIGVETGDVALFDAFLAGVELDPIWRERLSRAFRHPARLPHLLNDLEAGPANAPSGTQQEAMNPETVAQILRHAEIDLVGRRTLEAIAARLADKHRLANAPWPSPATIAHIKTFLDISAPIGDAFARLDQITSSAGDAYRSALEKIKNRSGRIAAILKTGDTVSFSTTLGRKFNYYTGFTFNCWSAHLPQPVAAAGRYDRLMAELGASSPVPAVGAAFWPERIAAALEAQP